MSALMLPAPEIDRALWALVVGKIGLHEVPWCLASWWWAGSHCGRESERALIETEMQQLRDDLNYWYWRAVAPEEHAARMAAILSDFTAQTARNDTARRWAALDAAERAHRQEAS